MAERDSKGRFAQKYNEPNTCLGCGKDISRYAIRCRSCNNTHYNKLGLRGTKGKHRSESFKQNLREKLSNKHWSESARNIGDGYAFRNIKGKTIREHILIFCEHYGLESLPCGKVIHHKNFDKLDNSINNLELMERSEHASLHNNLKELI